MLWTNEMSQDLSLLFVLKGYPILPEPAIGSSRNSLSSNSDIVKKHTDILSFILFPHTRFKQVVENLSRGRQRHVYHQTL